MKSIDQIMQERLTEKQINSINKEADNRIDEYLLLKRSIASELSKYIESNHLTFNDVKKGLDTSTSQTQRILKGESGFTLETLIKVGRFLGKSPRIIFE